MGESRHGILKSSSGVAVSTLICRVLGLLRTALEAQLLGGGALASAWGLAFTLPNQFRSILGEGALAAALMPIMAGTEQESGPAEMRRQFGIVFAFMGVLLALISLVLSGAALLIARFVSGYWLLAMRIVPLVMPYAIFMCLVGITGTVLGLRKVFFLPSVGNMLLNFFMIGALWFMIGRVLDDMDILEILSWSVLASGAAQLLLQFVLLRRSGVLPDFRGKFRGGSRLLRELFVLALPGIIGASASQLSFAADQILAGILSEHALPALKYSERLIYLPIGLFAVSLGSVLFAALSRTAAKGNLDELRSHVAWGLRMAAFVCIPMAFYAFALREPVMRLFFMRGKFDETSLAAATYAMGFYAVGIPLFCSVKIILPAYYSRKDTRTPLKCSLTALGFNILCSVLLMWPLKQGGIALATVLSSLLNNILLLIMLRRAGFPVPMAGVTGNILRCAGASLLAILPVALCYRTWDAGLKWLPGDLLPIIVGTGVFGVLYGVLCRLLGVRELGELAGIFRSRAR